MLSSAGNLRCAKTHKGVGALLWWVGLPFCVEWFALLWREGLKLLTKIHEEMGALLRWVGRFALFVSVCFPSCGGDG